MLTRKLFPKVFKKFQSLLSLNQNIQAVLNTTTDLQLQNRISDIYSISNLISKQISQLQKPFIQQFFRQFPTKDQKIQNTQIKKQLNEFLFDQSTFKFILKSNYNIQNIKSKISQLNDLSEIKSQTEKTNNKDFKSMEVVMCINACHNEKIDTPQKRRSLYFHQLKDMDKYIKVARDETIPPFIKQMNKKRIQYEVLDKKNPLGIPTKMPPLIIQIYLQRKVYFKLKYYLGQTLLVQIKKVKKKSNSQNSYFQYQKSKQKISGMRIPRTAQQLIFKQLLQNILELNEQKMLNYHKLAYIAGRIKKLQVMMDIHQIMWGQIQNVNQ